MKVRCAKKGLAVLMALTLAFGMTNMPVDASSRNDSQSEEQAGDIFLPDSGNVTGNVTENIAESGKNADFSDGNVTDGNMDEEGNDNEQVPSGNPAQGASGEGTSSGGGVSESGPSGDDPAEEEGAEKGQPSDVPGEDGPAENASDESSLTETPQSKEELMEDGMGEADLNADEQGLDKEAEEKNLSRVLKSPMRAMAAARAVGEPGLPADGYILKRAADDGYEGSAEFIAKVSDYYSNKYNSYDILVQVYEFNEDNSEWEAKGETQRLSNPGYVGDNTECLKKGSSCSFFLEQGEACAIYPVQPGTNELYGSTYSFDYWCWAGLSSTAECQMDMSWNNMYANIYNNYDSARRNIKTISLSAQDRLTWETGADGLPAYGLQIQFESEQGTEKFEDYAGIQIRTSLDQVNGQYYNGESTFGGTASDGTHTAQPAICYRAELYKKVSDGKYEKARTLTDHYYQADTADMTGLYDSFKEQLKENEVEEILRNGGVISIVPLDVSSVSPGALHGENPLGEDVSCAPVFRYNYRVRYTTGGASYGVSVENSSGKVCSEPGMSPLQKVTVRVTPDGAQEPEGLVIDGEGIPDGVTEHLFIKLAPSKGHEYNGNQALRFLARVFTKNADGTYSPKGEITADTHFKNWDFVQRDPSSSDQRGTQNNFDWQDNRYIECEITNQDIVRIYPIEWNSNESHWTWYPHSVFSGENRYMDAFEDIDILDPGEWSFSYQIGVDDTRNHLITGGTCEGGGVQLQSGTLVSTQNVESGEQHIVKFQVDTDRNVSSVLIDGSNLTDGGIIIDFVELENLNLTYEQFRKYMDIYIQPIADGTNGASMGGGTDNIVMKAVYFPANGSTANYGANNNTYNAGKFQKFDLSDMTEEQYNLLKNGGKLVLYPAISWNIPARFYSFNYAFGINSSSAPFTIKEVKEGESVLTEEGGMYRGLQTLSYKGPRTATVTISLEATENVSSGLGIREDGLPNYGLLFTVDGDVDNSSDYLYMELALSAPREKKNGESPVEDSHVNFRLRTYKKDGNGKYVRVGEETVQTVSYPEEEYKTVRIESGTFRKGTYPYVYALLPVEDGYNYYSTNYTDEFEFTYQITGMRVREYDIMSIQKNTEAIDPLDSSVTWSEEETGTGIYGDIFQSQTLSSQDGGTRLQNVKINVSKRDEPGVQKLPDLISNGTSLNSGNMENIVVIRNSAEGYTAAYDNSALTAESMPDVQVQIFNPLRGVNVGWGDSQLPYQAFLYNYKDGTYEKVSLNTSCYYNFDNADNSIRYSGNGPSYTMWGAAPGGSSTFHTHLADDQAIVIVPCANYYSFYYQVTIRNGEQYSVESYTVNGGEFEQKSENLFQSGTIANYGTTFQEVVLTTALTEKSDQTFAPLADSLPEGQRMQGLSVKLFDYDFPGLTSENYQSQTKQYKFLLDPLNHWDYAWNHIGDNKTLAYKGITQDTLGDDGTPVFNYTVPFSIFNDEEVSQAANGGTKAVYPAQFEFVYEKASGTYSYNSHLHHAQLEDGTIRQYDKGLGLDDWGIQSAGFFPFNRWEDEGGRWGSINNSNSNVYLLEGGELNYHFGMSMEQEFVVPVGGQINGNDMVFQISGDDDIWLFVDGKLILDMGGIHEAIKGEINFTQGTYTNNGRTFSLSEIFKDYDGYGENTGSWQAGTKHSFSFFYLERGGTLSNMDISFNLPLLIDFSVTKHVEGASAEDAGKEFGFTVEVYKDAGGTQPYDGKIFLVDKESGERTELTAKNGSFRMTLKDGETKWFSVQPEGQYFKVTEDVYDGFMTPVWTVDGQKQAPSLTGGVQKIYSAVSCANQRAEEPSNPGPSGSKGKHGRSSDESASADPTSATRPTQAAQTGDTAPVAGLALCGILSAAAIICMSVRSCKRKRR